MTGTRTRVVMTVAFLVLHPVASQASQAILTDRGALGLSLSLGLVVAYLLSVGPAGAPVVAVASGLDAVVLRDLGAGEAVGEALGLALAATACCLLLERRFRHHGPVRSAAVIRDYGLVAALLLPLLLLGAEWLLAELRGGVLGEPTAVVNTMLARSLGVLTVAPGVRMLLRGERAHVDRRTAGIILLATLLTVGATLGTLVVGGTEALVDAQIVVVPVLVVALLAGTTAYSVGMAVTVVLIMTGSLVSGRVGGGLELTVMDHLTWVLLAFGGMLLATEGDRRRALTSEFTSLFRSSTTPTMEVSATTGRIQRANPAMAAMTGWSEPELLGRSLDELVDLDEDGVAHCRAVFGGEVHGSITVPVRTATGGSVPVRCSGVLVDLGPQQDGIVQVQMVDLTQEMAREAALQRSNEALARFGRRVSHDLKQPLSAIAGYAGTLREHAERLDPDVVRTMHERLDLAARRAITQLDDAFEHAALAAGAADAVADLDACLRSVEDVLSIDLAEAGGTVERNLVVPTINVSGSMVRQILLNLVTNSLKYRSEHVAPRIRVVSRARHGGVEVVVTDNGTGLPAHAIERVFDRGARMAPGVAQGRGEGLADSRELAEAAGGWLRAEPWPHGARFVLWLPDATGALEVPVRVLIVDDEPEARHLLRLRLELADGVEVVGEAATVAEAVRLTAETQPDIVLLDRWLANRDGLLAVAELAEANPDARIVLLTSDQSPDLVDRARSGGVSATLHKFRDADELVRELVGAPTP